MAILLAALTKTIALFVWCVIIKTAFATTLDDDCPQMCDCRQPIGINSIKVDCGRHGLNESSESILAQELDLLLSNDKLRENLLMLSITNTPLTQVPMPVCQMLNLKWLLLDGNRLDRLPGNCFTNMTSLIWLSASKNNITELQDGLFDGLNFLEILDFSYNMIASIGLHVFSNPNDIVNLRFISLGYNRLRSLEPWPYIRGLHGSKGSKVIVSIQSNLISEFTNNVEWQFNCSLPSYANVDISHNIIRHLSDILDGWNISSLTQWFCIMHLAHDNYTNYNPLAFQLDYQNSYDYHCDCVDIDFYTHSKHFRVNRIFKDLKCSQPPSLANQYVNQVPVIDFVCVLSDPCPASCRHVYRPANSTFHVYCSAANLTSLPFDLPSLPRNHDKYKLDFSNNKFVHRLDHRPYLANTYSLDVSNCAIDSVDLDAWQEFAMMPSELYNFTPSTLEQVLVHRIVMPEVFLHGNKIESLSSDVTGINLTSVHLTLKDNLWKCSCDNRWMIAWFKSLSSAASSNVGDVLCASPSRLKGRSILQSDEVDFCVDPLMRMLKIVLASTLSVGALLVMLGFAVYRLRVPLYKRWKFHPFDRDECIGEDMDYDVFLCCSWDDNSPHGMRILQLLESQGYRVYYDLRDSLAGGPVMENVIQSIIRSKRTVCFISRNFLQSTYCMTQFEMAYHHNVAVKRRKRVILLMALDSLDDLDVYNASDTTMLRQFIRQYKYIDYRREDWLDKLHYALPLRGLLQHNDDQMMADVGDDVLLDQYI